MLVELSRREKEAGIKPDPEIDAFMKATALVGQETSLITDYVLKVRLHFIVASKHLLRKNKPNMCMILYRFLDWIFVLILWLEMI